MANNTIKLQLSPLDVKINKIAQNDIQQDEKLADVKQDIVLPANQIEQKPIVMNQSTKQVNTVSEMNRQHLRLWKYLRYYINCYWYYSRNLINRIYEIVVVNTVAQDTAILYWVAALLQIGQAICSIVLLISLTCCHSGPFSICFTFIYILAALTVIGIHIDIVISTQSSEFVAFSVIDCLFGLVGLVVCCIYCCGLCMMC